MLAEVKSTPHLKQIPVILLTTSSDERDVTDTYAHDANCYITKPFDFDQFINVIKLIDNFWLSIVKLPENERL